MALTSVFYDGPSTDTDRAKNRAGEPDYGVYGADDFQVIPNGSVPFSVKVRAGRAHGWGVTDTAATDQTVMHDPVAGTGATRWDLVAVRRNWQPLLGGPSELVVIKGGAFTDIPAGRKVGPGIEDDQPIAMVGWKSGQTAPFQIIDLRCWASNGGIEVVSEIAFEYLGKPGACVRFDGTTWRYSHEGNGVWGWNEDFLLDQTVLSPLNSLTGWSTSGDVMVERFGTGKKVTIAVRVERSAGQTTLNSGSHVSLGTLVPPAARGGSNRANYFQVSLVGPGQPARTMSVLYDNGSGLISIKQTDSSTVIAKGASFAFDHTYYIP